MTRAIGICLLLLAAVLKFGLSTKSNGSNGAIETEFDLIVDGASVMAASIGFAALAWYWINER